MSRKTLKRIHVDEIAILQMAHAAVEIFPRETFGFLNGEKNSNKNYRIYFAQISQLGRRFEGAVSFGSRSERRVKDIYKLDIIGDFHSHNGTTDSRFPSHDDLDDTLKTFGANGIAVILYTTKFEGEEDLIIMGMKKKVKCVLGKFVVEFYFYKIKEGIESVPRNISSERLVEEIRPILHLNRLIRYPSPASA